MTSTSRSGEVEEREGAAGVTRIAATAGGDVLRAVQPQGADREVAPGRHSARGALSVRHRARGQAEDDGRRVPHSSQPGVVPVVLLIVLGQSVVAVAGGADGDADARSVLTPERQG